MASSADIGDHLAYALQLGLGFVFLAAAIPKLSSPRAFAATVAGYRIVPVRLVRVLALGLIALEAFLAFALLSGWLVGIALPLAAVALGGFSIAVTTNLRRGRQVPCGCFGDASEEISARSLVRLGALLAALLGLVVLMRSGAGAVTIESLLAAGGEGLEYLLEIAAVASFLLLAGMWALTLPELTSLLSSPRHKESAP